MSKLCDFSICPYYMKQYKDICFQKLQMIIGIENVSFVPDKYYQPCWYDIEGILTPKIHSE